jgi:hypothetical protein
MLFYLFFALMIFFANLPFFLPKLFGFICVSSKHFGWCLLELSGYYVALIVFGRYLEAQDMPAQSQNWPFYVAFYAVFLVCGFPGFVRCFLWKKKMGQQNAA